MNKIYNILWKIFSIITVCLYSMPDEAHAAKTNKKTSICPRNYYVEACGSHKVGVNWLKGGNIKVSDGDVREFRDYYDYSSGGSVRNNDNFKTFLRNAGITEESERKQIQFSRVSSSAVSIPAFSVADANDLLLAVCGNEQGTLIDKEQISCQECPNLGITDGPSTVDLDYDTQSIVAHTWKFYTIADCFMKNFEDVTGTFVYVPIDSISSDNAQTCYYDISTAPKGSLKTTTLAATNTQSEQNTERHGSNNNTSGSGNTSGNTTGFGPSGSTSQTP